MAIGSATPPSRADLEAALDDCDLVVVENLLTIPLQLSASRVAAEVLAGRPALLHHHDRPWQRSALGSRNSRRPTRRGATSHDQPVDRATAARSGHRGHDDLQPDTTVA
ncbi:MAG: hypothetical protein R2710_12665 [Acidimicrobiales bacterium]